MPQIPQLAYGNGEEEVEWKWDLNHKVMDYANMN